MSFTLVKENYFLSLEKSYSFLNTTTSVLLDPAFVCGCPLLYIVFL